MHVQSFIFLLVTIPSDTFNVGENVRFNFGPGLRIQRDPKEKSEIKDQEEAPLVRNVRATEIKTANLEVGGFDSKFLEICIG